MSTTFAVAQKQLGSIGVILDRDLSLFTVRLVGKQTTHITPTLEGALVMGKHIQEADQLKRTHTDLRDTLFANDNFTSRRSTGHNMYDPDSLITGKEVFQGYTYANSKRLFPSGETYKAASSGYIRPADIARNAPRRLV